MMTKQILQLRTLLLLTTVTVGLAACGGDSGSSAGNTGSGSNSGSTSGNAGNQGTSDSGADSAGSSQQTPDQGGGSDQGGSGGTDSGNSDGGGNTTTGSAGNGTDFTEADSGLSHAGTLLPRGTGDQLSGALFSTVGASKAGNLPQNPAVVYEVVENHGPDANENCKALAAEYASCSVANVHIKDSTGSLDSGKWRIYFPSIRRVLRVDSNEFDVVHVNGDLNYLTPNAGFTGFAASQVKTIKVITEFSHLHESDMMPRYFLVRDGASPELIANTDSEDDINRYAVPITGDNRKAYNGEPHELANSTNRFDKFSETSVTDVSAKIIPSPESTFITGGVLDIGGGLRFESNVLSAASINALQARLATFSSGSALTVETVVNNGLANGQYTLEITGTAITIVGQDAEAVFHGAQSLLSLITPGRGTIPQMLVTDAPRFNYRGMHVDVARNFHSASQIRKLIDQMAAYKMNVLHMHLSDDEGWRLEIPQLPELTSVGAKRQFALDSDGNPTEANGLLPQLGSGPFANNQGSGHYSRGEFIQLLQYAQDRYINVIPELDMPAHARAAVVAMRARAANMGQPGNTDIRVDDPADTSRYLTVQHYDDGILNPCVAGTYNFLETVVGSVKSMYDDAGVALDIWHMGGDEAKNIFKGNGFEDLSAGSSTFWKGDVDQSAYDFPWERSPACQQLIASDPALNNLDDLTKHFVVRLSDIVNAAGIPGLYAYQDILRNLNAGDLSTQKAGVGFWEVIWEGGYQTAYEWPARGYETVIAVPDYLYFDFPQEIDPRERGYYWATRFTDTQKVFSFAPENLPQNAETSVTRDGNTFSATSNANPATFAGIQGQLWSETVRSPAHFDYMVFPRLLALAERAWHRADWEQNYVQGTAYSGSSGIIDKNALAADWNSFANALGQKELPKLDAAGVLYRIPTAGAKNIGGQLEINTQYPGLAVEYSSDGNNWIGYDAGNRPASATIVRARSANAAREGRATPVE